MNKILILMLSTLAAFLVCQVQAQPEYEKRVHVSQGDTLLYRVLLPEDIQASRKYPLILFLHGAGERGNDNEKQLIHGSKLFQDSTRQDRYQSLVVFPQCPEGDFWANIERHVDADGKREFQFTSGKLPTTPMQLVLSLMDSLKSLPYVDEHRIYVGGLSMGGMGTFELLTRRPDTFAAAIPICGGGDHQNVADYAGKVNMWVFHGGMDDVVPPGLSELMVDAIREAGGSVKFTLYPEAKHNSWDSAFAEPLLLEWLFAQKKEHP